MPDSVHLAVRRLFVGFVGLVLAMGSSTPAFAQTALFGPDPGRKAYVLPGPLVGPGFMPGVAGAEKFLDAGIEVSIHRFASKETVLGQLGYGGLVQMQVGGIPVDAARGTYELGTNARSPQAVRAPSASLVCRAV